MRDLNALFKTVVQHAYDDGVITDSEADALEVCWGQDEDWS